MFNKPVWPTAHRSHRLNAAEEKEKWANNQMGKVKLERQREWIPLSFCAPLSFLLFSVTHPI